MAPKDDKSEVEFFATRRDDGACYTLSVVCKDGLTDDEFAACLIAFAQDIENGSFKFDNDSGSPEVLSQ